MTIYHPIGEFNVNQESESFPHNLRAVGDTKISHRGFREVVLFLDKPGMRHNLWNHAWNPPQKPPLRNLLITQTSFRYLIDGAELQNAA